VWPPSNDTGKKANPALQGPAPEHMDTSPLPPEPSTAGGRAPQAPTQPHAPPQPPPQQPPPPPAQPDDPWSSHTQLDPPALKLPLDLNALNNLDLNGPMPTGAAVAVHALQRECRVLRGCGTADDAQCSMIEALPALPLPASCPAASECIRVISRMTCTQLDPDNMLEPLSKLSECRDAERC
jgi:hypothetical protein